MLFLVLPSRDDCLRILREAGCGRGVVRHCVVVSSLAARIARMFVERGFRVDVGLVEVGGLLHDVGRSRTHEIGHGVVGGEIVRELGLPEAVARVVERHVGAGLTAEEASGFGLPHRDFVPVTWEEKIVCYADKLVAGGRVVGFDETFRRFVEDVGVGSPAVGRLRRLHGEVSRIIGGVLEGGSPRA